MQQLSDRFLDALQYPHRRTTFATYQVPGGELTELPLEGGTVRLDDSARIRRTADVRAFGSTQLYNRLAQPGTIVRIEHGLDFGSGQVERVPVFCGELSRAGTPLGGSFGTVSLPLVDMATRLARSDFLEPYVPAAGTTRVQAISAIVLDASPGTTIVTVNASDTGQLSGSTMFTGSRLNAIAQLAADGGLEAFFGPSGEFIIRDLTAGPVAWTIRGLIKSGSRERPIDRLYNTVVVRPSASDGSQDWTQQVVQLDDPQDARHPSKIGVVPYFLPSPTILDAVTAQGAGRARLVRVQGTAEKLALEMIANPALEGGDMLRVVVPTTGDEPAAIYQHLVDGITMDLTTGGMSLSTRSQREEVAA